MFRKIIFGGVISIGVFIAGFMFLLRSCLSKYDERSVISSPILFEQNGNAIVFTLIKFEKTTSYEQRGGFTSKSVNTSYNLQVNDAVSGNKLLEQALKKHGEIKSFPIEIIGSVNNIAWLFAGELMAFNPFTLEKVADNKIIETKNPSLAGKLINERKYYVFNKDKGEIIVTVNDGTKYILNATNLTVSSADETSFIDKDEANKEEIEEAIKKIQKQNSALFEQFRNNSKAYSEKRISAAAYRDSSATFIEKRSLLDKLRDSIYALQHDLNDELRQKNSRTTVRESLQRGNNSFSSIQSSCDTFNTKWYGLYTTEELTKLWERFEHRSNYNDAARNGFYTASIAPKDPQKKYSEWIIGEVKQRLTEANYLHGGFLLDKNTGFPFHLSDPDAFLIVHKDKLGKDGIILISKTGVSGKELWTINTGLKELADWSVKGNRMIITGRDNDKLSSGEINLMHTVDLDSGKFITYDFFQDKLRDTK